MSVIDPNTATVTVSFDQKVPDSVKFSTRGAFVSMTLPVDVEGLTTEQALNKLQQVRVAADTEVKLAVFASLGLQPKEIAEGVLAADLSLLDGAESTAAPAPKAAPRPQQQRSPRSFGDPEADVVWNGANVTVRDLRDAKATGRIGANMPDLKIGNKGFWLTRQDGSVNEEAAQLATLVDAAVA